MCSTSTHACTVCTAPRKPKCTNIKGLRKNFGLLEDAVADVYFLPCSYFCLWLLMALQQGDRKQSQTDFYFAEEHSTDLQSEHQDGDLYYCKDGFCLQTCFLSRSSSCFSHREQAVYHDGAVLFMTD